MSADRPDSPTGARSDTGAVTMAATRAAALRVEARADAPRADAPGADPGDDTLAGARLRMTAAARRETVRARESSRTAALQSRQAQETLLRRQQHVAAAQTRLQTLLEQSVRRLAHARRARAFADRTRLPEGAAGD
ncbi:hypothetical protein [Dactylosporangium sp. NPDC005555]|uniref:hypothetical protein n=1 Tax=Dactylosporangium sp. NPDC005555 TaxID=3154889 RepID=UPI0033A03E89